MLGRAVPGNTILKRTYVVPALTKRLHWLESDIKYMPLT